MKATQQGHTDMVRYLAQECRADVNVRNYSAHTAIKIAADRGFEDIQRLLIPLVLIKQPEICVTPLRPTSTDFPISVTPSWNIPPSEIELVEFVEINVGGEFRGRWLDADAAVKLFLPDASSHASFQDEIIREHPDEIWAKLHEAALGVQYLHARGVVHGDLKGNNIVIRSDKKTKVTDFGLSSLTGDEGDTRISAASHWVAPECFLGGHARPTFASNVYSLASNDEQWQLVKSMCAFDATKRLRISTVVDELASFANCSVKVDIEKRETAVSLEEIPSVISAVKELLMQLRHSSQDSKTPDVSLYSLFGSLWDELEEVFCRINDKLNVRWRSVFCVLVHDADISTSQLLDITTNLGSLFEMTLRCYALRRRLDKVVDANHLSLACLNWEAGSAPVLE
ncbi:unnamed protein product [Phytophthora lilii]|uniref:Unnamed protein product n=1 Tax=Phytophthora lilii TaxID=2077276 RepID=A0A9W6WQ68_9STRA|nr:unnamed protein product [Phytophthora lilii]